MNTNSHILLIDDDADDLDLMKEALLTLKPELRIDTAFSGNSGLNLARNYPQNEIPSLMIIDYNMPDLTGAEVLEQIVKDYRFNEVLKIIWSTSDSPHYQQICMERGADHYVKKPHSYPDLIELGQRLLHLQKK